jgi:hypothetical protein
MSNGCPRCRADVAHCHGTLIEHLLGHPECTDDGCADFAPALHALAVGCDELACRCGAAAAGR